MCNYQGKAYEWAKHDLWVRLRQPTIISLCVGEKKRNTEKSVRRIHWAKRLGNNRGLRKRWNHETRKERRQLSKRGGGYLKANSFATRRSYVRSLLLCEHCFWGHKMGKSRECGAPKIAFFRLWEIGCPVYCHAKKSYLIFWDRGRLKKDIR